MRAVFAALCLSGLALAGTPQKLDRVKVDRNDLKLVAPGGQPVPPPPATAQLKAVDAGTAAAAFDPAMAGQLTGADAGTSAASTGTKRKPTASQVSNPTTK